MYAWLLCSTVRSTSAWTKLIHWAVSLPPTCHSRQTPRFRCCSVAAAGALEYLWFKYDLGQKYYVPQVRPNWGSNLWPPDHDSHISCHWDTCTNYSRYQWLPRHIQRSKYFFLPTCPLRNLLALLKTYLPDIPEMAITSNFTLLCFHMSQIPLTYICCVCTWYNMTYDRVQRNSMWHCLPCCASSDNVMCLCHGCPYHYYKQHIICTSV